MTKQSVSPAVVVVAAADDADWPSPVHAAVTADDADQLVRRQQVWQEVGMLVGLLDGAAVQLSTSTSLASV